VDKARKSAILGCLEKTAAPAPPGALTRLMTAITGAPVKAVGESVASMVGGRKALGGIHRGKRLKYVGRKNISRSEYAKVKALAKDKGGLPGEVEGLGRIHKIKGPGGQTTYQKDQYSPGGMVGFAMKHPIITGLGGYLGYKMLTAPKYPSQAGPRLPAPQAMPAPVNPNPWG
jgi:hypothetical protein